MTSRSRRSSSTWTGSTGRRWRRAPCGGCSIVTPRPSKKTAHAGERQRPDVPRRRRAWFELRAGLDPDRLVFIDETGTSTKMARPRGRSPRGERCRAPVPHGHRKTTTFVGALRTCGMTAPMVLDGAMHGAAFLAYVERILVPTLGPATSSSWTTCPPTSPPPCAGPSTAPAPRFPPACSPDFNPIEMAFAKLKAFLKKHAPRTVDDLWDTIAQAIDTVSPAECSNYSAAAGYDRD